MRHRVAQAFYVLAVLAQLYMMTGCGVTLWRDVQQDGVFITWMEHVFTPGAPIMLVLWSLPSIVLYAIGRAIDKKDDDQNERWKAYQEREPYPKLTPEEFGRMTKTIRQLKDDGWLDQTK